MTRSEDEAAAHELAEREGGRVSVHGHADQRGDERLNRPLSRWRAQEVARRLQAVGVPADRVRTRFFGSSRPLVETGDDADHARNRRVEIHLPREEP